MAKQSGGPTGYCPPEGSKDAKDERPTTPKQDEESGSCWLESRADCRPASFVRVTGQGSIFFLAYKGKISDGFMLVHLYSDTVFACH